MKKPEARPNQGSLEPSPSICVLVFILVILTFSCEPGKTDPKSIAAVSDLSGEDLAKIHCGSCHLMPDPTLLSRKIWQERVLPHMSWRLGRPDSTVNPPMGNSMQEQFSIGSSGVFPNEPQISEADWSKIIEYYVQAAPPEMLPQQKRPDPEYPMPGFSIQPVKSWEPDKGGMATMIKYDPYNRSIYVSGINGQLTKYSPEHKLEEILSLAKVLTDMEFNPDGSAFLLSVGNIHPNDEQLGELLLWESNGTQNTLITGLRRPVDLNTADLNGDRKEDLIICEFGYQLGQISLYFAVSPGNYRKEVLYEAPGAIKTIISDINGDQNPDIIALIAQGNEGIFAFINKGDGIFELEVLLRFPPVFGASDLELADVNGDDILDIILANGDNGDYSYSLKNFHGMRIYLNDGTYHFEEGYFFPMYGATRLIAADFDRDQDIDIAVASFFPDLMSENPESFIYLQNQRDQSQNSISFSPFSFTARNDGRWMLIEKADLDQDGYPDILLGSSMVLPLESGKQFGDYWREQNLNYLVIKNQGRN